MTSSRAPSFPPAAGEWLVGGARSRVLVVGLASVGLLRSVGDHRFTVVVDSLEQARSVRRRAPHASVLVSDAHRLPILPTSFDAVLVHQSLHNLEIDDAMREFARVLKPRGHLAVSYTMRDDSVPWVRRLVSIMRSIDPDAMGGDYGVAAADGLEASPFAAGVSRSDFRLWVPISRVGLLEMVAGRFPDLDRQAGSAARGGRRPLRVVRAGPPTVAPALPGVLLAGVRLTRRVHFDPAPADRGNPHPVVTVAVSQPVTQSGRPVAARVAYD